MKKITRCPRRNDSCPHSPDTCFNQIVRIIYGETIPNALPDQFSEQIASPHHLCPHCLNCLLTAIPLGKFLSMTIPNTVIHWDAFVSRWYADVMRHPKMYKLMMNQCRLNKSQYLKGEAIISLHEHSSPNIFSLDDYVYNHNFGAICACMANMMLYKALTVDYLKSLQTSGHLDKLAMLRTLWFSMKYWNKYHVRFFVNHYLQMLVTLNRLGLAFYREYGDVEVDPYNDDYYMFLRLCIDTVCVKAKRVGLKGIPDADVPPNPFAAELRIGLKQIIHDVTLGDDRCYFHYLPQEARAAEMKMLRRAEIREFMDTVPCGWFKCKNTAKDIGEPMKMCKQCRMTFYCSRRCQKKAWNRCHRLKCSELFNKYSVCNVGE